MAAGINYNNVARPVRKERRALTANLPCMREQSQLEEMRAALRGDRERAEQRRRRSDPVSVGPKPGSVAGAEPGGGSAEHRPREPGRRLFRARIVTRLRRA